MDNFTVLLRKDHRKHHLRFLGKLYQIQTTTSEKLPTNYRPPMTKHLNNLLVARTSGEVNCRKFNRAK